MASSVAVCKVGLHWDSPKAPRVYSQPKLVKKGYQSDKRNAQSYNKSSSTSARIQSVSSSSTTTSTSVVQKSFKSTNIRCLDSNMMTRLEGRSSAMIPKLAFRY